MEINRQNIDVNETELKNLRDGKIKGLIIRAEAKWQVEGEKRVQIIIVTLKSDILLKN
jgi:hypothetical protein